MTDIQPFTFPTTGQTVRTVVIDDEPIVKGLESHLYIVEFGDHGIKVGITSDPATRLQKHQRDGKVFGRPATRGWITGPHVEAQSNERALVDYCKSLAADPSLSGEYFPVSFDWACRHAASLPRTRGDRETFEAEVRAKCAQLIHLATAPFPAPQREQSAAAPKPERSPIPIESALKITLHPGRRLDSKSRYDAYWLAYLAELTLTSAATVLKTPELRGIYECFLDDAYEALVGAEGVALPPRMIDGTQVYPSYWALLCARDGSELYARLADPLFEKARLIGLPLEEQWRHELPELAALLSEEVPA